MNLKINQDFQNRKGLKRIKFKKQSKKMVPLYLIKVSVQLETMVFKCFQLLKENNEEIMIGVLKHHFK